MNIGLYIFAALLLIGFAVSFAVAVHQLDDKKHLRDQVEDLKQVADAEYERALEAARADLDDWTATVAYNLFHTPDSKLRSVIQAALIDVKDVV